jgi:hypothetical protein
MKLFGRNNKKLDEEKLEQDEVEVEDEEVEDEEVEQPIGIDYYASCPYCEILGNGKVVLSY